MPFRIIWNTCKPVFALYLGRLEVQWPRTPVKQTESKPGKTLEELLSSSTLRHHCPPFRRTSGARSRPIAAIQPPTAAGPRACQRRPDRRTEASRGSDPGFPPPHGPRSTVRVVARSVSASVLRSVARRVLLVWCSRTSGGEPLRHQPGLGGCGGCAWVPFWEGSVANQKGARQVPGCVSDWL